MLLSALCGSALAEDYPTNEGSKIITGAFSFSSAGGDLYEYDESRYNTFHLTPSMSYFIVPGFALGAKFILNRIARRGF